jgi:hypothetical protein
MDAAADRGWHGPDGFDYSLHKHHYYLHFAMLRHLRNQ